MSSATVAWLVAANLLVAAGHPVVLSWLPGPLAVLVVAGMLFVAPVAGCRARFRAGSRALGIGITRDAAIAAAVLVATLGVHRVIGVAPTQRTMWLASLVTTNLGFVVATFWARPVVRRSSLTLNELSFGATLFLLSFALYYHGATSVVPPLRDHDHEVQATGYSLVTRFEPFLLTDRGTFYYLAHPPLLHFLVAGSFLHFGSFPALGYYDTVSRRALASREGQPTALPEGVVARDRFSGPTFRVVGVEGKNYVLAPDNGGPLERSSVEAVELGLIVKRFVEQPHSIETRTPNVFIASATVALLGLWGARISRRTYLGALMAAAYATSPEVFVRSSYGGYFAIAAFTTLLMLLAVDGQRGRPTSPALTAGVLAGAVAALADHKSVLLPAAAAVVLLFRRGQGGRSRSSGQLLLAVIGGFALGTAIFWVFGLVASPGAFVEDHLKTHLLDRITHTNPLGYARYPKIGPLWWEFFSHTGYVLVPIALFVLFWDAFRSSGPIIALESPDRGLWLGWIALVAISFSIIDWRMTKHVAPILLPLYLGLMPNVQAPKWRTGLAALTLGLLVAWNGVALSQLLGNFEALPISPEW